MDFQEEESEGHEVKHANEKVKKLKHLKPAMLTLMMLMTIMRKTMMKMAPNSSDQALNKYVGVVRPDSKKICSVLLDSTQAGLKNLRLVLMKFEEENSLDDLMIHSNDGYGELKPVVVTAAI
jgi:hypothetical protein